MNIKRKVIILFLFVFNCLVVNFVSSEEIISSTQSYKWKYDLKEKILPTERKVTLLTMSPDGSYIGVGIKHNKKVGARKWIFDYYDVCFFDKKGNIICEKKFHREIEYIKFSGNGKYVVIVELEKKGNEQKPHYALIANYYDTTNWNLVSQFEYGEYKGGTGIDISYDGRYLIDQPWDFEYFYRLYVDHACIDKDDSLFSYYSQIYDINGRKLLEVIGDIKLFKDNSHFVCNVPGEELALYKINGEKLWSKKINGIAEISSDGNLIAVGGYVSKLKTSKPYVYLFNREGKLLWERDIGSKYRTVIKMSENGKYILVAEDAHIVDEWIDISSNPLTFYMFDTNGNLIWKKIFYYSWSADKLLWPAVVTNDGLAYGVLRYLCLGKKEFEEEKKDSWYLDYSYIFLFDKKGNKIWGWKGEFSILEPKDYVITPDGKYICLIGKEPGWLEYKSRFLYFFDNTDLIEGRKKQKKYE